MPKAAPYRLSWDPEQRSYTLHDSRRERTLSLVPDNPAWFGWLASISSFTFSGQHGQLTVRQETRSGSTYWYAYHRAGEKMTKKYLGLTLELTLDHLEEVARVVANCLMHFDKQRYELGAWVVMPNHVHVVVTPHDLLLCILQCERGDLSLP